jgi:hypothetical protein
MNVPRLSRRSPEKVVQLYKNGGRRKTASLGEMSFEKTTERKECVSDLIVVCYGVPDTASLASFLTDKEITESEIPLKNIFSGNQKSILETRLFCQAFERSFPGNVPVRENLSDTSTAMFQ